MPCSTNAASASPLAAVKSITVRFFDRSNVAALFCHQTCALRPLYVYTITFRARPQARRICCSSGCPTAIQRSIAPVRSLRHKSASSQLKPPANCSASCACSANASNRTIMRSSVSEGCRANVSECAWKYLRSISLTCSCTLKMVDLTAKKITLTVPTVVRCDCSIPPLPTQIDLSCYRQLATIRVTVRRRHRVPEPRSSARRRHNTAISATGCSLFPAQPYELRWRLRPLCSAWVALHTIASEKLFPRRLRDQYHPAKVQIN